MESLEITVQCNRLYPRNDSNYYRGQGDGLSIKSCPCTVARITGLILESIGFLSMGKG